MMTTTKEKKEIKFIYDEEGTLFSIIYKKIQFCRGDRIVMNKPIAGIIQPAMGFIAEIFGDDNRPIKIITDYNESANVDIFDIYKLD